MFDDFEPVDDFEMREEDVPHEHCGACMTLIDRAVVFTYVFEGVNKRLVWCHDCAKLCRDELGCDMYEDLDTAIIEHDELCENEDMLAFAHRRIEALRAYALAAALNSPYKLIGPKGETKILTTERDKNGRFILECEGRTSKAKLRIQTDGVWSEFTSIGGGRAGTPKIHFMLGTGVTMYQTRTDEPDLLIGTGLKESK